MLLPRSLGGDGERGFASSPSTPSAGHAAYLPASGPLDCLLHSGLSQAGAHSRLSTELSNPSCSKQGPCNDLAGLRLQHFDTRSVTLSGKSSESWSVRFGGRAVSGAGLQRSVHLLLFNFSSEGKNIKQPEIRLPRCSARQTATEVCSARRPALLLMQDSIILHLSTGERQR